MDPQRSLELILHREVQQLLDNFAAVMRVHVVFFGPRGEVLRQGRGEGNCRFCQMVQQCLSMERCLALDRERQALARRTGRCQIYTCHAGLWEAIMPVMTGGELLGYIVFGQIRGATRPPDALRRAFPPDAAAALSKAYLDLPFLSADGMDNLAGLMKLLVDYIVRNELVTLGGDRLYLATLRYLEEHLTASVTLPDAARALGRSASTLSHLLQRHGTTFKRLLIEKRLARADALFKAHPELSVKEAATRSGFNDPAYFSRLYRRHRGTPPSQRRGS